MLCRVKVIGAGVVAYAGEDGYGGRGHYLGIFGGEIMPTSGSD